MHKTLKLILELIISLIPGILFFALGILFIHDRISLAFLTTGIVALIVAPSLVLIDRDGDDKFYGDFL